MSKKKYLSNSVELMQQWDYVKNNPILPQTLTAGSGFKAWWICKNGHSWQATVKHRSNGTGCPYCSNRIILKGYNDLKTVNPILASQWDYNKNGSITPEDVVEGSYLKVWWKCDKGHNWESQIMSRAKGNGCPYCAGLKPIPGINDFATICPHIVHEWDYSKNIGITPMEICYGSRKKYWWKCEKGHSWQAITATRRKSKCPICTGKKVLSGFNDLLTLNPELAKEWDTLKNILLPSQVTQCSGKLVWWKCKNDHSWQAKVSNRKNGRGCPYCMGKIVLVGENDLATLYPDIASEWDYGRNNGLKPNQVMPKISRIVWWKCTKGHSWQARIINRTRGNGCPYCCGIKVIIGDNDLRSIHPTLSKQWDYELNKLNPENVHAYSNKFAWWKCEKGHSWQAKISNRANGKGCPYCSGNLPIVGVNDLTSINPNLVEQWDYAKNSSLSPSKLLVNSSTKVWWVCNNGHSWKSSIKSRNLYHRGCPYCSGSKPIPGETDLLTLNPLLAQEWDYEKNDIDIQTVSTKSNKKVWWKCKNNHHWKATVCNRSYSRGCPYCAGKVQYSTKYVK